MGADLSRPAGVRRRAAVWLALALLIPALFLGGPGPHAPRSHALFWDLGHILLFALLPVALFRDLGLAAGRFRIQAAVSLLLALAGGTAIELIQSRFGRTASAADVVSNGVGALTGLFFLLPGRLAVPRPARRLIQAAILAALALEAAPALAAFVDELDARRRFPVLSDLESPFELGRWGGRRAALAVERGDRRRGGAALRVDLQPGGYSGAFLEHFPGDWRGFGRLRFRIYNATEAPLALTCRIHDRAHEEGEQRYADRFNRELLLPPGWSEAVVELEAVEAAPAGRRMDLGRIQAVGFIAAGLAAPAWILIDDVRLEP